VNERVARVGTLAIPLLAGAVAYSNVLGNGFVLDDFHFIVENPSVTGEAPLGWLSVTTTSGGHFYRPLGLLSFRLDHLLFGASSLWMHLASGLYHLLATALVVLIARRLIGSAAALAAGLLFAVHPVHVEAVTGLANRPEVLATIFYLAAILARLRLPERWSGPTILAAFLLALLCKESAVTLPVFLLLVDWLRPGGRLRPTSLLWTLPALFAYYAMRTVAFQPVGFTVYPDWFAGKPLWLIVLNVLDLIWRYTVLLVFPLDLCADWGPPRVPEVTGIHLGSAAGLAVVLVCVIGFALAVRRRAGVSLGLGLGIVAMAVYLHIVPLGVLMAERFLYLPSAGFCLAAGAGMATLSRRLPKPLLNWSVLGVVALSFTTLTLERNVDWKDSLTLWRVTTAHPRATAFSHANLGLSWYWAGERDKAKAELERALRMAPQHSNFRVALARIYAEEGRRDAAIRLLEAGRTTAGLPTDVAEALGQIRKGQAPRAPAGRR
jgi:hypothetical protein